MHASIPLRALFFKNHFSPPVALYVALSRTASPSRRGFVPSTLPFPRFLMSLRFLRSTSPLKLLYVYRLAHHLHIHTQGSPHNSLYWAVRRYVLCKKSQFIFLYMHCAFLHKAYLLTAQCSGTGATQPAIETAMTARSPRSRIALWMVCVSCTFLTQAPLFTHSLSNAAYIVPPQPHQPAAIRLALGVAFSQCINPARGLITAQRRWCCTQGAKTCGAHMSLRDDKGEHVGKVEWPSFTSPSDQWMDEDWAEPSKQTLNIPEHQHAGGSQDRTQQGRRCCVPGQVLRVRPAADNIWHANRVTMARDSTFIYSLMYKWPTEWLRTERQLNNLARELRDDPPPPKSSDDPHKRESEEAGHKSSSSSSSTPFACGKRYRVAGKAGRGAFSVVCTARDLELNTHVAIKRVEDAAEDASTLRRLCRELALLRRVRGHANVIEIRDLLLCKRTVSSSFLSQSPPRQVTDVYIVTELMQSDLGRVLDHHNSTLTTEQVRALMFQFVLGLAHLHENGIMHRDIKPGNLLVDKMWRLKICDLGIARESSRERYIGSIYQDTDAKFTDYVVTRPYRSPELLMGSRCYDGAVDMWAVGCVLAELLAGQEAIDSAPLARDTSAGRVRLPLFPGRDHKDMVQRIVAALGHPSTEVLERLGRWEPKAMAFVEAQPYPHCDLSTRKEVYGVESVADHCMIPVMSPTACVSPNGCPTDVMEQKPVEWAEVFPWADTEAIDLLNKLLCYDPALRPTAKQALAHKFFAKAAPPLKAGQERGDIDVNTAFKRAALRSARARAGNGAAAVGCYEVFWDACDKVIFQQDIPR